MPQHKQQQVDVDAELVLQRDASIRDRRYAIEPQRETPQRGALGSWFRLAHEDARLLLHALPSEIVLTTSGTAEISVLQFIRSECPCEDQLTFGTNAIYCRSTAAI